MAQPASTASNVVQQNTLLVVVVNAMPPDARETTPGYVRGTGSNQNLEVPVLIQFSVFFISPYYSQFL